MGLSTHILDLTSGQPASGVKVTLFSGERELGVFETDEDGRCQSLLPGNFEVGLYRLEFAVGCYFERKAEETFYDVIPVIFRISDIARHYHVPLLLSQYGYSTYRGS